MKTIAAVMLAVFAGLASNEPNPPTEKPKQRVIVIYVLVPTETEPDGDMYNLLFRPPPVAEVLPAMLSL